jgi:spore germination cell wall hydrolase CwlJ-like protein
MNPDYPEAPVSRADVAGGLMPTAREKLREGMDVYRPNAAPAVTGQQYEPQQGGTALDSTDAIRLQNTGPYAPVGRGGDETAVSSGSNAAPYTPSAAAPPAAAPVAAPSGLMPDAKSTWWSQVANVLSPDASSEAPKGSWIDRNKGLLDILSLIGGGLVGMTGKRSLLGAITGGISGAGAASQAVQKAIADRAKTAAETTNIPFASQTQRMQAQTQMQEAALKTHDYINKRFQPIMDDPNNPATVTGYYDLDRGGMRVGPEVVANIHAAANAAATQGQNTGAVSTLFQNGPSAVGGASANGARMANNIDFSQMPNASSLDVDQATRMVLAEAGGQGVDGMRGVAHVIANRAALTGKPLSEVISQPGQFEPWATKQNVLKNYDPNSAEYKQAKDIVQGVLARPDLDITQGSTHFLAPDIMKQRGAALPAWANENQPTVTIGGHAFSRGLVNGQLKTPAAPGQTNTGGGSNQTVTQAQPPKESEQLLSQYSAAMQKAAALPEPQRSVFLARAEALKLQYTSAVELERHVDVENFKSHNDLLDQTGKSAAMANNLKQQTAAFLDALKNQSTGPLAPSLQEISGTLNQLLPGGVGEKISEAVVGYNPNEGATIIKLNNAMTATLSQLEGGSGRQLLKQWQSASAATPSIVTPKGASEFLLKNVIQPQADHDINRYNMIKDMTPGRDYYKARAAVQNYDASHPWYKTNEQRRAAEAASILPKAEPGEELKKLSGDNSGRRFVVRNGQAVEVKP